MTESILKSIQAVSYPGTIKVKDDAIHFRSGIWRCVVNLREIVKVEAKDIDSITYDEIVFTIWTIERGVIVSEVQKGFSELETALMKNLLGFNENWRESLQGGHMTLWAA